MLSTISCVDLPQVPERPITDRGAAAAPGSDAGTASETLRIGAWNLRKLGFEAGKDHAAIARIIAAELDLVALLEVVWSQDEQALAQLTRLLAPSFTLIRTSSPRPNLSSPHSEYYVVAYRNERVAPCAELPELSYFADGDGSDDSATRGLFLREPAFGCFRARHAAYASDFLLAVYHAQWGDGAARAIANEVRHVDRVFAAMRAKLPSERMLFMIGDFNLLPAELAPLSAARDRTLGSGSTLDAEGNLSSHLYDHLLAFGEAANAALVADAHVLDVRGEAIDPKQFRRQISDHLPIVAQLRLSEDDD